MLRLSPPTSLRLVLRTAAVALAIAICPAAAHADDDDPIPPPFDPAPGFEGLLPRPVLPPGYVIDQSTVPYGIRQVFNTPVVTLGQSFTPTLAAIDWAAFVFQNNTQPNTTPGPGTLRVTLYDSLGSNGSFGTMLGRSDEGSIASDDTAWLIFRFPETIELTPGERYFLHVEQVDGYPSWVGGRLENFYFGGSAFGFLQANDQRWGGYDFAFAQGVVVVPEPASATAAGMAIAGLASLRKFGGCAARPARESLAGSKRVRVQARRAR